MEPSYQNGFAPRDFEPAFAALWRGCIAAYAPLLGATGTKLRDWSGRCNNGDLTGFDASTAWAESQVGRSLLFDDVDDQVVFERVPTITMPLTFSAWIKANAISGSAGSILAISKIDTSGGAHYWLLRQSGNAVEARSRSGSTGTGSGVSGLTTNWSHVAAVFTSTTSRQVFLNGIPGNLNTATRNPLGMDSFTMGYGYGADADNVFNGCIAEAQVWNRALTQNEISQLALRPGIMFEPRRKLVMSQIIATTNKRRKLLLTGQN